MAGIGRTPIVCCLLVAILVIFYNVSTVSSGHLPSRTSSECNELVRQLAEFGSFATICANSALAPTLESAFCDIHAQCSHNALWGQCQTTSNGTPYCQIGYDSSLPVPTNHTPKNCSDTTLDFRVTGNLLFAKVICSDDIWNACQQDCSCTHNANEPATCTIVNGHVQCICQY